MDRETFDNNRRGRLSRRLLQSCALLALSAGLASGCRGPQPDRPNVLLVTIDTLSFRDVGHLGGSDSTPHIDRFAADATIFERAYSTSSWTGPAVASQFTGLYPSKHGLTRLFQRVPDSVRMLAEDLSGAGYSTAGIISNYQLREHFGFARGFESWDEQYVDFQASSPQLTDAAIGWLRRRPRGKPFFLYVHYLDPHFPYVAHEGFGDHERYRGPLAPSTTRREFEKILPELEQADLDYWHGLYRGEVRFTDAQVGRLLDALDQMQLGNTVVVVTSDHGEEFFEHGWFEHTRTLYEEIARVVLLVRWPGASSSRVATPVSLVSVAPTILEAAGIEPDHELHGRSLASFVFERTAATGSPVFLETDFVPHVRMEDAYDSKLLVNKTALVEERLKLIHDLREESWSLFDLETDPFETISLYGRHESSDRMQELLARWEQWRSANGAKAEDVDPSAADIESLRDLGYLQ